MIQKYYLFGAAVYTKKLLTITIAVISPKI